MSDAPQSPSLVGALVGRYRVLRLLGRGGMGSVYEAVHEQIGQRAAVKVMAPSLAADPAALRRFLREARAVSLVQHEGLVKIFDFGQLEGGAPYILMELLGGETLRARLDGLPGRRLPLPQVLSVGRQIAAALCAAHAAGIAHLDLKPDNLVLLPDELAPGGERVRLFDFGIARLLTEEPTPAAAVLGTTSYMAPEQILGGRLSGACDVYALGVLLYEAISGAPPFAGEREAVLQRHLFEAPEPLRARRPGAPAALEALLGQMLDKSADVRPSMAEVAAALQGAEAGLSATAPQVPAVAVAATEEASVPPRPPGPTTPAPPRRLRALLAALGAALLILGAFAALRRPAGGMVPIPGGAFFMGSTAAEIDAAHRFSQRVGCRDCERELYEREAPRRRVAVSPFELDATEVTSAAFAAWLDGHRGLRVEHERLVYEGSVLIADLFPGLGIAGVVYRDGRFQARRGLADRPMTQVTWDGARRYCEAQGKRLPTEAEWELAARRGGEQFPWGDDEPTCAGVVFGRKDDKACRALGSGPAAVGTAPQDRTPLGVRDLGGNVAEWVLDRFLPRYPDCGACQDPLVGAGGADGGGADLRVVRGGAWYREAESCRAAGRSRAPRDGVRGDVGFRCARGAGR